MATPLNRKVRPVWESWEVELMEDRTRSDAEVASLLPKRTQRAINQKRRRERLTAFRYCMFCGERILTGGKSAKTCLSHRRVLSSWESVRYLAGIRGIPFELSLSDFYSLLWGRPCIYCGARPKGYGVDRVDSSRGYEADNVVPCCLACNRSKGNQPMRDWIDRMERTVATLRKVYPKHQG